MRLGSVALALLVIVGCGGKTVGRNTPPAASGVHAFITALRSDDPAPAYRLLSTELRDKTPFAEFEVLWKQSAPEREHRAAALEESLKGIPDLGETAQVSYPDGRIVDLVREGGEWRLQSALVTRYHAGSPHVAVQLFADALAARNYEAVMRSLTTRRRNGISHEVDSFATTLIAHLDSEITFVGKDRAVLRWEDGGKRYKVMLHREGDEWRIDDIDITTAPAESEKPAEDE